MRNFFEPGTPQALVFDAAAGLVHHPDPCTQKDIIVGLVSLLVDRGEPLHRISNHIYDLGWHTDYVKSREWYERRAGYDTRRIPGHLLHATTDDPSVNDQ